MARGESIAETPIRFNKGGMVQAILNRHPIEQFKNAFRSNIRRTTRIAKREMLKVILNRLDRGVKGQTYTSRYVKNKNELSFTPSSGYSEAGPVDLEFSGQLKDALRGRGRAKPTKDEFRIWLGFQRQGRRPKPRSPGAVPSGGDITNRQLAEILNGERGRPNQWKIGSDGRPLHLHPDEEATVMRRTASELLRRTNRS